MPCHTIRLPGGGAAIVCSGRGRKPKRCGVPRCGAPAGFQCDYPMGARKTCDVHLCARHAREVGPDQHLCPYHYQLQEN
jgi:hypothetical protein